MKEHMQCMYIFINTLPTQPKNEKIKNDIISTTVVWQCFYINIWSAQGYNIYYDWKREYIASTLFIWSKIQYFSFSPQKLHVSLDVCTFLKINFMS